MRQETAVTPDDNELIRKLASFDSPTISNAIEQFHVRDRATGYASVELHCQYPELQPMVGYAVTCTAETAPAADELPGFALLLDTIQAARKPVVLVIGWSGDDASRACVMGEMTATGLARMGVVGIVTDVAFRDWTGIHRRVPQLQIFARGCVVSHGRFRFTGVGQPTVVAGLRIEPGALLHGDENGLVEIPQPVIDELPAAAEAIQASEIDYFDAVTPDGVGFSEVRSRLVGYR